MGFVGLYVCMSEGGAVSHNQSVDLRALPSSSAWVIPHPLWSYSSSGGIGMS